MSPRPSFNFGEQHKIGKAGEDWFAENFASKLERLDGRRGDFRDTESGDVIELKTDTYSMAKTPNFFIERWSDCSRQTAGSVWQAMEHGCTVFVYLFAQDKTYFIFRDLPALRARLEQLIATIAPSTVKNSRWVTLGYKVPRAALADLYEEVAAK